MIKFFRHIRQRLLSEHKFSKYLLYAIGEIILVVIGILIALQINTWSEEKKTKERERNYLALVKQEMSTNLESIEKEHEVLNEFLENLSIILELYARPNPSLTNKQLSQILAPIISRDMDFNFKDGTLNEIISTGNLKDITNDSIRNILASIGGNLERVRAQEATVNNYNLKASEFLEKNGSTRQIVLDIEENEVNGILDDPRQKSNLFLLKSDEFENIMVLCALTGGSLEQEYYTTFQEEIKTLITLIDKELAP